MRNGLKNTNSTPRAKQISPLLIFIFPYFLKNLSNFFLLLKNLRKIKFLIVSIVSDGILPSLFAKKIGKTLPKKW